jgi:hypothetical protein
VQDTPHQTFDLAIDGVLYRWGLDYYDRPGSWYLTLADSDGVAIITGFKLSPGWNPLRHFVDVRLPAGALYFLSTIDPAGRQAFNEATASLVHFSQDELDDLVEAVAPETLTFEAV